MELPLTPIDFLLRARRLFSDREGIIEHEDGRRAHVFTYAQMAERAARLAQMLQNDFGVEPGDRVAWLCGNRHELLEAYFGVLMAGAVLLPLNIRLSAPELRGQLDDSRASVLVRDSSLTEIDHPIRRVLIGDEYEERLAAQPHEWIEPPPIDEREVAEIFYTSGSTGMPKGAMLTHRGLYLHAIHSALTLNISKGGLAVRTMSPLQQGAKLKARFKLPGGKSEIEAASRVAWTDRRIGMGLQFEQVEPADQAAIDEFIDQHFFSNRKA